MKNEILVKLKYYELKFYLIINIYLNNYIQNIKINAYCDLYLSILFTGII